MFSVFQIKISEEVHNFVNSPEGGHSETAKRFPEYHAHMETMFHGAEGYKPEFAKHYDLVCGIEADDLEDVFRIGNIGPEEKIKRISSMHSISVGDVVVDPVGDAYIVDSFGFKKVEFDEVGELA
jgi:hypothetical protein